MTVGGASGSPAVFQGEASRQGAGGAGALTPYPMLPAAAIPPSVEGTGREGICKIHGEAGSQWLGKCILGSHTGAARDGGGALTPSPTFPAAAIRPVVEGTGRERHLQNPWKGGIPVAWQMHLGVTHGGRKGRGGALTPSPTFPAAAMPPRVGGTGREGICKIHGEAGSQWLGKCILGSHTGAARGRAGHWPLNLGFPTPKRRSANKVIGGRPPSHGAGGHLMHGARGAEKGG